VSTGAALNFCSHCGAGNLEFRIPEGDSLPRLVCPRCATVHYQNPKIVTGCLPVWEDKILLCRRAIEPRYGLWTLPAGFLENHESLEDGALRETLEEAHARVEILDLYTLISILHVSQLFVMFRARLLDLDFGPGSESLEVRLFEEAEIPWEQLAFRTISRTLRNYFADRLRGSWPVRRSSIAAKVPPARLEPWIA
jgi:ADP-ribose pyrophosphatase YjhB (NUDIX family)